jgi:Pentapeptide repeats (8 copies)
LARGNFLKSFCSTSQSQEFKEEAWTCFVIEPATALEFLGDKPMASEKHGHLRRILQKIDKRESLAGVDLRNLYLSGMDLSSLDLRGANLKGCRLCNGKLGGSDLTNADLTDAVLTNANFEKADLVGTLFRGAIVAGADFSQAKGLNPEQKNYLKSKGATGL